MKNPGKLLGRALVAPIFVGGGINQLMNAEGVGKAAEASFDRYGVPSPVAHKNLALINGAGMVALGGAMAAGISHRAAAFGLATLMVPTTVVGHAFWEKEDPAQKKGEQIAFMKNLAIVGGLLYIATDKN